MNTLRIETAPVFEPLLNPARYRAAWGGRGSGKSWFFAGLLVEECMMQPGTRAVCIREVQKSLKESAKRLIEDQLIAWNLGEKQGFRVLTDRIETPGNGVIIFQGMQDHTAESVKSLENFRIAWCEESQSLSARSLGLLRPTIRAEGSELWFSWNPTRKSDPVDQMFRGGELPTNATVVKANWSDNPWFPSVLEQERQDCLRTQPDQYGHIWEGDYATVLTGAYYAAALAEARKQGRIGKVQPDPLMQTRAFWDIGFNDATSIWIAQFVGREIRVLDYYEAQGQPLAAHLDWLRSRGWGGVLCVLPHDGAHGNAVTGIRFEDHIRAAGFQAHTIANMGKGAAMKRIEALRRLFPSIWWNEDTTRAGLDALGWYHEKRDEGRNIGLGPDHDWSSHCFVGATEVLTRYGTHPICKLPFTGEILTPCGWKQYIAPRITRKDAPLVEVTFTSGYSVKCTPDHLFLTENGWKSAESLTPNTVIQSTLTNSRSILMAAFTACGRVKNTWRAAAKGFTAMSGFQHLAPFHAAAISTTVMGTRSTTSSPILNVSQLQNTCLLHGTKKKLGFLRSSISLLKLEQKPLHGINPPKGDCGIKGKRLGHNLGQNGSAKNVLASVAAFFTWQSFARLDTKANIARLSAKLRHTVRAAFKMNTHVVIESVRPLNEKADVWCLTVPDAECFSLANGAVVHNCADAAGLMAVAYEAPREKPKARDRDMAVGSWMG